MDCASNYSHVYIDWSLYTDEIDQEGYMFNQVILIGRTTKDIELKKVGEHSVVNFSLAVDKGIKDADGERQADFFQVTAWNKDAEFLSNYINKGQLIHVVGRLENRTYEDSTGATRYVTDIVTIKITPLEKIARKEGTGSNESSDDVRKAMNDDYTTQSKGVTSKLKQKEIKDAIAKKYLTRLQNAIAREDKQEEDLPF